MHGPIPLSVSVLSLCFCVADDHWYCLRAMNTDVAIDVTEAVWIALQALTRGCGH